MYSIGKIKCKKSCKKYNIEEDEFYTCYRDALTKEYDVIINDEEHHKLTQYDFTEYFNFIIG